MSYLFIQTGGTIDKDYPHTTKGWAFEFGEPATRRLLQRLDPSFDYEIVTACQKDSLEISTEDRDAMIRLIRQHPDQKIIITHGTDTLLETARYLAQQLPDRIIVLTGAMRPERFSNSDAPMNVGAAIATANLFTKGVFISMHGIVKPYDKIQRDLSTGKFY